MSSSDGSELDVFFDSSEVLSADESVADEEGFGDGELGFRVWSCEPESVVRRRERFLEKMGFFEFVSHEKIINGSSSDPACLDRMSVCNDEATSSSAEGTSQFLGREQNSGSSSLSDEDLKHLNKEDDGSGEHLKNRFKSFSKKRTKKWLLKFLGKDYSFTPPKQSSRRISKVKEKAKKKSHRELTKVQEIEGHKGMIWAMKFSPDGKFLATGGEDGVLRIWKVTLSDSIQEDEASYGLAASKKFRNQPLVLLPEKVLHIEEQPVQELHGHGDEILDLAWSDSNLLVSASKDKTVRLWRMGSHHCQHVFHHNNYVTCVQFNPVNKNHFISGSIDGKARIWGLSEERVVAWADARDAISAICYKPDGKGFVVGAITGTCCFYQTSGNDVEMEEQIRVPGRKKTSGNKITGVQFCPENSDKLLVSSDDSKLRMFHRTHILHKFKGPGNSRNQSSASFVSSGKHILSIGDDSRVYLWSNDGSRNAPEPQTQSRRNARYSRPSEWFHSPDVSSIKEIKGKDIETNHVMSDYDDDTSGAKDFSHMNLADDFAHPEDETGYE
ncbi:PREDICTED: WD repeat-containing protein 44 [Tarenaya hassleriana]|uniref:WD repeat-containing protein 44 n=1 Tax=Tarenaya hassleriana TaxID=28532 RepID=UPI00053C6724|nr:PREDICTED: WD repeat-containing protein 44 [Tarenaya hassleriana]